MTDGDARAAGDDGLRFGDASGLAARAEELVRASPRTTEALARRVLGLRSAPAGMAERMVRELLSDHPRLAADGDGVWRLRERPGGEEASLEELDYVVVDVETTGATPSEGDRVTEIAAVEVTGGRVGEAFSSLVDPGRPIPDWISRMTGITEEMVADAPPFEEVAGEVRARLEGRVFVAHNVPFDWRFVSAEMRRAASVLPEGPRLCTLRLARRALPDLPRKGLDAVTRHYDVEVEDRHRAEGDARATARVLLHLLEEADRKGVRRWEQMDRWLSGGAPPAERD